MVKLSPAGRRWTSSRRFETSMPTKTGALSMTRFRWMRADQPWPPFGLRGHGRRGARYLPGLAGPMGKRAPAGLPDPDTYRIGSRQHTNGEVQGGPDRRARFLIASGVAEPDGRDPRGGAALLSRAGPPPRRSPAA